MKALALIVLLPAALGAGTYGMEGGDLARSGTRQSPSSIRGPLQEQWMVMPSTRTGAHPILTQDLVILAGGYSTNARRRSDGAHAWSVGFSAGQTNSSLDAGRNLLYSSASTEYVGYPNLTAINVSDGRVAWTWSQSAQGSAIVQYVAPTLIPEGLVVAVGRGSLVCLDPDTRAVRWRRDMNESLNTPAYAGGKLYVAGRNGSLTCIDAADGRLLWRQVTVNRYVTPPTLGPTMIYMMTNAGKVEARRILNGGLAWTFTTYSFSSSAVALCDGVLVAASDDRNVYGLDPLTGQKLWNKGFSGNFARSSPIIICGVVYISGCAGAYYGLDVKTGGVLWIFNHDHHNSFVDWAVDGDQAFVMDAGGRLHAFKAVEPEDPATCACLNNPTPGATPTPVAGPCALPGDSRLRLWLDADSMTATGLAVTHWGDLSGSRHHATNAYLWRPVLEAPDGHGHRGVYFDGVGKVLYLNRSCESALSDPRAYTLLMRVRPDAGGSNQQIIFGGTDRGPDDYFSFGRRNNRWFVNGWESPAPVADGRTQVVTLRSRPDGMFIRVDGQGVATMPPSYPFRVGTGLVLGNQTETPDQYFKGSLQAILVYDGVLSDQQVADLEECLMPPQPTPTPTETATATPSFTPTPTDTATATWTPTETPSFTATPTHTYTHSHTPTFTHTPTHTFTHSETPTFTHTPTHTWTPTETHTPVPDPPTPSHTPTVVIATDCPASIDRVQVSPNPQTGVAMADRMVSVKLGCSADEVIIEVYSQARVLLFRWVETDKHVQKGQWVHSRYPHEVDLPNGLYFVKVTVRKGSTYAHASTQFMVLR